MSALPPIAFEFRRRTESTRSANCRIMHRSKMALYSITSSTRATVLGGILRPSAVTQRVCARKLAAPGNVVLSNGPEIDLFDRHRSRGASRPDWLDRKMPLEVKIRRYSGAVSGAIFAISVLTAGVFVPASAAAQKGEPVKIGYSMALTGGLAANGRSALLAQKIWEEDTNAKGGLLRRPVKLIPYDHQTNPAAVPGIYVQLLHLHQGELIIRTYRIQLP